MSSTQTAFIHHNDERPDANSLPKVPDKMFIPLCLKETAGKPVERNQQGQPVSIITPQPITVAPVRLFPKASSVKDTLSITVGGYSFYI